MIKNSLILLALFTAYASAELPITIKDSATRKNLEYLDGKVTKAQSTIDALSGATLSTSTVLAITSGGTGATTITGAQGNLQVPSQTGSGASGTWGIDITGNAATATDNSKVLKTGDTMTGQLTTSSSMTATGGFVGALIGNAATATSVPTSGVDLSTVTTAIDLKVSKAGDTMTGQLTTASSITATLGFVGALIGNADTATSVPATGVDLSTVTTALAGKLSNTATVPPGLVDLSTVTTAIGLKVSKAGDTMTGALTMDQPANYVGGVINFRGDFTDGTFGTLNFTSLDNATYYSMVSNKRDLTLQGLQTQRLIFGVKDYSDGYQSSLTVSSAAVSINSTTPASGFALSITGNTSAAGTINATGYSVNNHTGLTAVCNSGQVLTGGAYEVGIATAGACASVAAASGDLTWDGRQVWKNKVGFGSPPFDGMDYPADPLYGVWITTPSIVRQPMYFDMASGAYLRFGSRAALQTSGLGSGDGIMLYDQSNSWNGTLALGAYGAFLYSKGAIGAPLLGINNAAPAYALDVTGGIRATSSMTASAYHGDGSNLTGVIQSTAAGNYALRVATATYLATAPGACSAGEFISGLTADGTKTCGVPAGGGDAVLASTQTFTGENTFTRPITASPDGYGFGGSAKIYSNTNKDIIYLEAGKVHEFHPTGMVGIGGPSDIPYILKTWGGVNATGGFFEDGVKVQAATQTWTGANTFTITDAGRTSISSATIADIVLPTRDKIKFGNQLSNSSSTVIAATYSTSQTTFDDCVTGSTLTITTHGNSRVMVNFSGAWYHNVAGAAAYFGFKLNGVSHDGNRSLWSDVAPSASVVYGVSFTVITGVLPAGSHSICLNLRTGTGIVHVYDDINNGNQFWIQELR